MLEIVRALRCRLAGVDDRSSITERERERERERETRRETRDEKATQESLSAFQERPR